VVGHDGSSIGEIAERTGLPQSQVSAAVARLKEAGSVDTRPDPADRRRMLVRQASTVSARVTEVRATTIDDALAATLGTHDVADVVHLLETLAARLLPDTGRPDQAK
jgi:DNA-binding MarR family transcriptional regulator